jgi:hypothetical protein
VIPCKRILFLACLVYFIVFTNKMISDAVTSCKQGFLDACRRQDGAEGEGDRK